MSPTASLEGVLHKLEIAQAINATTYDVIADVLMDRKIERRYARLHEDLELKKLQYTGQKAKAIGRFIFLSPFLFKEKKLVRELVRLVGTTFCGPETFYSWKAKLSY